MFNVTESHGFIVIKVEVDSFTVSNVPSFRQELTDALSRSGTVVIDLQRVNYMDSASLGALIVAKRQVDQNKGRLLLAGLQGQAKDLLNFSRMIKVFDTAENLAEAEAF